MNDYLVSILVLSYNQQDTILQTLRSVASQETNFLYEVLIGDDCSTDNTRLLCEDFRAHLPNCIVRLYPKTENVGLLENYQRLIADARGQYIACCAGDDYWTDNTKIQKQADFLDGNLDYGLVYTKLSIYVEEKDIFQDPYQKKTPPSGDVFDQLLKGNFISALSTLYRRELAIKAIENGLFKNGFLMEDYPLWLYINERSKTHLIDENMVVWRKLRESVSNSQNANKLIKFDMSVVDVQIYFAKRNNKMDLFKDHLLYLMRKRLCEAYHQEQTYLAKAVFYRIKQVENTTVADRIMLWATIFPSLKHLIIFAKKLKDKINK